MLWLTGKGPVVLDSMFIGEHDKLAAVDGNVKMSMELLSLFAEARRVHGYPVNIISGCRTFAQQNDLFRAGYKAAKVSAHCYGIAIDVTSDYLDGLRDIFRVTSERMGYGKCRTGFDAYGGRWLHVDLAYLLPNNPRPDDWVEGVSW